MFGDDTVVGTEETLGVDGVETTLEFAKVTAGTGPEVVERSISALESRMVSLLLVRSYTKYEKDWVK